MRIAALRVLEASRLADKGDFVAGHSLGEYTALCAAGAFGSPTTARLLKLRGQAMQAAVPVGVGAMCGCSARISRRRRRCADAAAQGEVCKVANDNDPGQVVLSGHAARSSARSSMAKEKGIKRGMLLPVSAPFHCSLMQPAADAMARGARPTPPGAVPLPLYANVTAAPVDDPGRDPRPAGRSRSPAASAGAKACWRWRRPASSQFVELGGKVLGPMVKRTAPDATVTSVVTMDDIEALAERDLGFVRAETRRRGETTREGAGRDHRRRA